MITNEDQIMAATMTKEQLYTCTQRMSRNPEGNRCTLHRGRFPSAYAHVRSERIGARAPVVRPHIWSPNTGDILDAPGSRPPHPRPGHRRRIATTLNYSARSGPLLGTHPALHLRDRAEIRAAGRRTRARVHIKIENGDTTPWKSRLDVHSFCRVMSKVTLPVLPKHHR